MKYYPKVKRMSPAYSRSLHSVRVRCPEIPRGDANPVARIPERKGYRVTDCLIVIAIVIIIKNWSGDKGNNRIALGSYWWWRNASGRLRFCWWGNASGRL